MLKSIPLEQPVGGALAHDITEIQTGVFRDPAFRKGHTVCRETSVISSGWVKTSSM